MHRSIQKVTQNLQPSLKQVHVLPPKLYNDPTSQLCYLFHEVSSPWIHLFLPEPLTSFSSVNLFFSA